MPNKFPSIPTTQSNAQQVPFNSHNPVECPTSFLQFPQPSRMPNKFTSIPTTQSNAQQVSFNSHNPVECPTKLPSIPTTQSNAQQSSLQFPQPSRVPNKAPSIPTSQSNAQQIFSSLFGVDAGIIFFLEFLGPERFEKLREACRIHFHVVAPPKTAMVPSYDQKTKKANEFH